MIQIKYEDLSDNFNNLIIKQCYRSYSGNRDNIPVDSRDEESDGNIFIVLSNNKVFGFYIDTEEFTIRIKEIDSEDIPINSTDVFNNKFWKRIHGRKIIKVEALYGILETPFGIKFSFDNNIRIEFLYISENEYTFDALIIKNSNG